MPLLHDLGSTLFAIRGHADEDASRAFARMLELAERADDTAFRLRAMDGLLLAHAIRAELGIARGLAERMIVLAREVGNTAAVASARVTLGTTLFFTSSCGAGRLVIDPSVTC